MTEKELLENQLKRITTKLFKDFIGILEDIKQDHLSCLASISSQFPPEILKSFNYLDFNKSSRLRKRVLDQGNDAIREMLLLLKDFQISIDNKEQE